MKQQNLRRFCEGEEKMAHKEEKVFRIVDGYIKLKIIHRDKKSSEKEEKDSES